MTEDLVEHATVGEVRLVGFLPAAEYVVDREQLDLGKRAGVLLGHVGLPWTIEVLDLLYAMRSPLDVLAADDKRPGCNADVVTVYWKVGATDRGLKTLAAFPNLRNLRDLNVSDAGMQELPPLEQLEEIDFHIFCKLTDSGIKSLKAFKKLPRLDLGFAQITDNCVEDLKELKDLRELRGPSSGKISDARKQELRRALPNCTIE